MESPTQSLHWKEQDRSWQERESWKLVLKWEKTVRMTASRLSSRFSTPIEDMHHESLVFLHQEIMAGKHLDTTLSMKSFVIYKSKDACLTYVRSYKYPVCILEYAYSDSCQLLRGDTLKAQSESRLKIRLKAALTAIQAIQGSIYLDDNDFGKFFRQERLDDRREGIDPELHLDIEAALEQLSERDRSIIHAFFYSRGMTEASIGASYGISGRRIRARRDKILSHMRLYLRRGYHAAS